MEEKIKNPDKNPSLPSYKLAKLLHDSETEKRLLASQVAELKVELQTARNHMENSKYKTSQLAARLQAQRTEMEHLHLQIKKIDNILQNARGEPDSSQQRGRCKTASGKHSNAKVFSEPQDRLVKELNESRDQFKEFLETRAHVEQERMQELNKLFSNMKMLKDLEDLKVAYELQKEKNLSLQQELEQIQKHLRQEDRFHAEKAIADMFLIRELRAVIEEQRNNAPEMRPLLSTAEDSEVLTFGQDTLELLGLNLKATQEENGPVFDLPVSKSLPYAGALDELPTKNKSPLIRKTLHRFLGWKKTRKDLTQPKSSGDSYSSPNISN